MHVFNVANLVLIFIFFRNVAFYQNILRERALIANNEIITLRASSYEETITKTINRTINAYSLAIVRNLDFSKMIEGLFDNDY